MPPLVWLVFWWWCVAACPCSEDGVCGGELCVRPPPAVAPTTTSLLLRATPMEELERGAFRHLPQLESLRVENNQRLTLVRGGAFLGLQRLQFLSLSFTGGRLRLAVSAFAGLRNLTRLRLVKAGLTKLGDATPALAPAFLPALRYLDLSENALLRVEARDLGPLAGGGLQELTLALCQLEAVHEDALAPLTSLGALYLGHNLLNATALARLAVGLARHAPPLRLLDLQDLALQRLPPTQLMAAVATLNITTLLLKGNQFPTLPAHAFPLMPSLQVLDLREVSALAVDEAAFALLPGLRVLLLGGNKLTSVGGGVLLPQLESLDVSGSKEERRLQPDFTLGGGTFAAMRNLKYLNLSLNRINVVGADALAGLHGLSEQLCLNDAHVTAVEDGAFRDLGALRFLTLADNPLGAGANITAHTFQGLVSLEVLLLDRCGLTHLEAEALAPLRSLQYLSLAHNDVHTLAGGVFAALPALLGVDLSHNLLESWRDAALFSPANRNLTALLLAGNKLTYLTPAMLGDFAGPPRLELQGNPFNCYAPLFSDAKAWLHAHAHAKPNLSAGVCYSPDAWKNRNISEFVAALLEGGAGGGGGGEDGDVEVGVSPLIVGVAVGVALLGLAALLGGVAYAYRAHVRYWLFLARDKQPQHRRRLQLQGHAHYQYDAFVSYSNEDRNFVVRLVAMLENYEPFLKLCVYERDFEIGSAISEAVLESVALSRRALLVVSDAFARSQWCQWETHLAQQRGVFGATLVMVKLGDVADAHLTPTLRYLLRTRVYLQWDPDHRKQRLFWEKLRAALAPPPTTITTTTSTSSSSPPRDL